MAWSRETPRPPDSTAGLAFLLSQVGAHSAARFAERLVSLGLKPPHVGILRAINEANGLSQQALGDRLGVFPSRLVGLLDDLERRELLERRESPTDRRTHALHLTEVGRDSLEQIRRIGLEHGEALCAALNESERAQLADFLERIAAEQQLTPGVHPGYRKLACPQPDNP